MWVGLRVSVSHSCSWSGSVTLGLRLREARFYGGLGSHFVSVPLLSEKPVNGISLRPRVMVSNMNPIPPRDDGLQHESIPARVTVSLMVAFTPLQPRDGVFIAVGIITYPDP